MSIKVMVKNITDKATFRGGHYFGPNSSEVVELNSEYALREIRACVKLRVTKCIEEFEIPLGESEDDGINIPINFSEDSPENGSEDSGDADPDVDEDAEEEVEEEEELLDYAEMSYDDLKKEAAERGLEFKANISKANLVSMLEEDDEYEEDEEVEDEDEE